MRPIIYEKVDPLGIPEEQIRNMSWIQRYKLGNGYIISIVDRIVGESIKNFTVYTTQRQLHIVGDKWFIKTEKPIEMLTVKNGIIYGKISQKLVDTLTYGFRKLEFLRDTPKGISPTIINMINKRTLRSILCGNITSQEALYKTYIKTTYHTQIPWKLYREYLKCPYHISIYNILCYTKNPQVSLKAWVDVSVTGNYQTVDLLRDVLNCAAQLQQKVDLSWSEKRLAYEHQQQIYKLNALVVSSKDTTPMWEGIPETEEVHPLLSERDVFTEATAMQHCLYTNYYTQMLNNKYIAFSITPKNEDMARATLGINVIQSSNVIVQSDDNSFTLGIDQIKLYRNGWPADEYYDIARKYLEEHHREIENALTNKIKHKAVEETGIERTYEPEIPW